MFMCKGMQKTFCNVSQTVFAEIKCNYHIEIIK